MCPVCGCSEVRWSGCLGKKVWNSCRDCGMEYATDAEDEPG